MTTAPRPEGRLPRGRHNLSPETVVGLQRQRMFRALAETVSEKGFVNTRVADILQRAGVSRETFYEQFASKHDCFAQGFEHAVDELFGAVMTSVPPGSSRVEQFDQAIGSYLEAIASQPELAYLCMVEVYAAGPEMGRRRVEVQRQFVNGVQLMLGAKDKDSRFACEAFVGAISSMVTARLAFGDVRGIRRLKAPFGALVREFLDGSQARTSVSIS
ncbi:MAG: TetR/AcrR family transcriptional regulator [Nitrososphaerales archaeon]